MASIYKRKQDRNDRTKPWYYAYVDENGQRHVEKGCTDYKATQEIAAKIETDVAQRRKGLITVSQEILLEQGKRPIGEHLQDFMRHVRTRDAKERAPRYLLQVENRLKAFIASGEIVVIAHVTPDRIARFLDNLKKRKLSEVTLNEYIGTLKGFTTWACSHNRATEDPLANVHRKGPKKLEKKHPRRAYSTDEIGALLAAARSRPLRELQTIRHGPKKGQQTAKVKPETERRVMRKGLERELAYLLAIWTGLRRNELRHLRWGDIRLDTLPARIDLRGSTTKSKRADRLVLHPQIVERLKAFRPTDAKPMDRVLAAVPSMKVLRADLRQASIDEQNNRGRLDLHALRKGLATYMAACGVPQRLAQAHMRHTDPRLTSDVYTDESLLPIAAAITGLPALPTGPVMPAVAIRMTGTDGERAAPQQRTPLTAGHSGASACVSEGVESDGGDCSQVVVDSGASTPVRPCSRKRVMGLEPTTFTLAT
jgi:integrase